ncbi:30S ribosomal protein THX [uncultured Pontibacter sp.]|nr:30S ribosomal protein THX [uncultured Pontibacter sp.]
MGKGDKKSRKGKITKGTFGKKRTRKDYNLKMKPFNKEASAE